MMTDHFYDCVVLHVTLQHSGSLLANTSTTIGFKNARRKKGEKAKTIVMDQRMRQQFGLWIRTPDIV